MSCDSMRLRLRSPRSCGPVGSYDRGLRGAAPARARGVLVSTDRRRDPVPGARSRRRQGPAEELFPAVGLAELGLHEGAPVRFRRREGERWKSGTAVRREADGSLGVRDSKGSLRAFTIDLVEVRDTGPRGGIVWEPLAERAARSEQMKLL